MRTQACASVEEYSPICRPPIPRLMPSVSNCQLLPLPRRSNNPLKYKPLHKPRIDAPSTRGLKARQHGDLIIINTGT